MTRHNPRPPRAIVRAIYDRLEEPTSCTPDTSIRAFWIAAAARAAAAAARADSFLADFAESAVQILIDMGAPGVQWLDLASLEE